MNQARIISAVKTVANFAAGVLTTHGAVKAAHIVNAEDTTGIIALIVVWAYSHFVQHTDANEATPTPMKDGTVFPPVAK